MSGPAIIRQLSIERFRGIKSLKWNPADGMNVILGGGDVGKTTLLEAVALLLSPSYTLVPSEADYWQRKSDDEFCIRAVLSLPSSSDITQQRKLALPWAWNGTDAVTPPVPADGDDDMALPAQPVYCFQVRGTAELEIKWEIVHPNDEVDILSAALRRQIGVVRLSGDERNDRDLRLVYGSALDRLLADKGLKGRISQELATFDLQDKLSDDASAALEKLDKALKKESLPSKLKLGLTSSQGLSIGALIGLLAASDEGVSLPLASWGAGTRRMATLQIAAATESETRITVIDELERGLEPYRVRKLARALQTEATQSFVTTHSAVAISTSGQAHLWYLDPAGTIGHLPREKIAMQQERDPETFLCRLAIIAEGLTEKGLVTYLLDRAIDGALLDHGLRVCHGQGNEATLNLLEALAGAGLRFGGFADNEQKFPGRWSALKTTMGKILFQWTTGSTDQNVIAHIPEDRLTDLLTGVDPDLSARRRFTLADRLGISDKSLDAIQVKAQADSIDLRVLIIAAATGNTDGAPDADSEKLWKGHGRAWFKTERGGRELAGHMFALGAWPALKPSLLVFLNAVRATLGQPPISDVPHE